MIDRNDRGGQADVILAERLSAFSGAILRDAGADDPTARDATRAMLHSSLHGIDSHGIRLLPHYRAAIQGGRLKGQPQINFVKTQRFLHYLSANNFDFTKKIAEIIRLKKKSRK